MNRFKTDELRCRVDEVLFYKWDPMGINHYVTASAEYRSYISRILQELKIGDLNRIIAQLKDIQINSMRLNNEEGNIKEIVELLLSHKEAIENRQA